MTPARTTFYLDHYTATQLKSSVQLELHVHIHPIRPPSGVRPSRSTKNSIHTSDEVDGHGHHHRRHLHVRNHDSDGIPRSYRPWDDISITVELFTKTQCM